MLRRRAIERIRRQMRCVSSGPRLHSRSHPRDLLRNADACAAPRCASRLAGAAAKGRSVRHHPPALLQRVTTPVGVLAAAAVSARADGAAEPHSMAPWPPRATLNAAHSIEPKMPPPSRGRYKAMRHTTMPGSIGSRGGPDAAVGRHPGAAANPQPKDLNGRPESS